MSSRIIFTKNFTVKSPGFIILLLLGLFNPIAFASESYVSAAQNRTNKSHKHAKKDLSKTSKNEATQTNPPAPLPFDQRMVQKNIAISKEIDAMARNIDIYLTGAEITDNPNKTEVILSNQVNWSEGGEYKYSPRIQARLRLPNFERKMQLKFTSFDEDKESQGINQNRLQTRPVRNNYGASVGFFHKLGKIKVKFRPRFGINNTSYQLSFESESETEGKRFRVDPKFQLFGASDTGTGEFGAINFSYLLSPTNTLSFINEEQYTDGNNTFSTNHGFSFGHAYTKRLSQNYNLIYESNSRPVFHLDRYVLSSTLAHELYRNVLHYYVTPYLSFAKMDRWACNPGLNLKLDFIF
jgi:hypothetical protein